MAMLSRRLATSEEEANTRALQSATPDVAYLMPTATGLAKSIMDAIAPLREFLLKHGIHDYSRQSQGEAGAVRESARIVTDAGLVDSVVSMYRPVTKQGDPRIWFSGLARHADPNDLLAIFPFRRMLHVFNLSRTTLAADLRSGRATAATRLLWEVRGESDADALELLELVRAIAADGLIPADGHGDTAVGRTLETRLDIRINSYRRPDWRQIEIKARRAERANRRTLFAAVPVWALSGCKSSAEILDRFGYDRDGVDRKLYVTVSSLRYNAQGLRLAVDPRAEALVEESLDPSMLVVAVWPLSMLRERLREKHRETFWVDATSVVRGGTEYFHYKRVEHTRRPVVAQLERLIEAGHVTVDHLIKDVGGKVVEKGPLFKIDAAGWSLLFPSVTVYDL